MALTLRDKELLFYLEPLDLAGPHHKVAIITALPEAEGGQLAYEFERNLPHLKNGDFFVHQRVNGNIAFFNVMVTDL